MRFAVRHLTIYRYDVPVRLGSHVLRLLPRPGQGELRSQELTVWPEPVRRRTLDDALGNRVLELDFEGACRELSIESRFEMHTHEPPELPVVLPPLPWTGAGAEGIDPSVLAFARELAARAGHEPLAFLDLMARTLYTRMDRHIRHEGHAQAAAETLATGRGACRDLTVLFMDAARSQGMESRFVSGYQAHAETVDGQRHLHAWPEVLLPGLGHRAWDPTHGLRVADGHLALCAAPAQAGTMPVEGGFFFDGETVRSTLDFSLTIET